MRDRLLSLDQVHTILADSEPLDELLFIVGDQVRFDVAPGWQFAVSSKPAGDPVDVWITVGGGTGKREVRLTKECLLQLASVTGMSPLYAETLPAELLGPSLNYWYREGLHAKKSTVTRAFKLLISNGLGAAVSSQHRAAFSNLRLLEEITAGISNAYDTDDILVDAKFAHSLHQTWLRLVIPQHSRVIERSGTDDDRWSAGITVHNSLTARDNTRVDGYLFRWTCTNGAIDVRNPAGGTWQRRGTDNDGIWDWARNTVEEILRGLDHSLDAVQSMVDIPVAGHASDVLRDVFAHYGVRLADRAKIIEKLAQADTLTMYTIMQAITEVANEPGMKQNIVDNLMRMGGDLPHASSSLCDACRRLSHSH